MVVLGLQIHVMHTLRFYKVSVLYPRVLHPVIDAEAVAQQQRKHCSVTTCT